MPSLKDVKMKIVGVGKTKQITRAMNMVASAKLRGAQGRMERFRPYAARYREVIGDLAESSDTSGHPLLQAHEDPKNCRILLITSDRGLCGAFNSALAAEALRFAEEKRGSGLNVSFVCVGRKGRDAVSKKDFRISRSIVDRMGSVDFQLAEDVARDLVRDYENLEIDEVWIVYGEFQSIAHQPPRSLKLLPMQPDQLEKGAGPKCEYVYEPSEARLLADLLPRYVSVQIYNALLETSASENAARMAAMDNATRNCNELIRSLTLLYNKTRQASITSELIDIVGGAEALKG